MRARCQRGVVRDHHHGLALSHKSLEQFDDGIRRARIKVPRRLISNQQGWVTSHSACNGGKLLLSRRDQHGEFVGKFFQPNQFQQFHGALRTFVEIVHVHIIHREHDVLEQGQCGQKLEELEDDAQILSAPLRALAFGDARVDVLAADHNLPLRRMVDARDHVQQRGFSTARFADDGNKFAAVDGQVNTFEDGELARGIGEAFDDAIELDHGVGVALRLAHIVPMPFREGGGFRHSDRINLRVGAKRRLLHFRLMVVLSKLESSRPSSNSPSAIVKLREKREASPMSCVTMMMVLP